jgi:hypothetical protein
MDPNAQYSLKTSSVSNSPMFQNGEYLPPVEGDRVLFCRHADVGENHIDISKKACSDQPFHWYFLGNDQSVMRIPDGARFPVRWLAICNGCNAKATPDTAADFAAQDAPWIGEAPNITRIQ